MAEEARNVAHGSAAASSGAASRETARERKAATMRSARASGQDGLAVVRSDLLVVGQGLGNQRKKACRELRRHEGAESGGMADDEDVADVADVDGVDDVDSDVLDPWWNLQVRGPLQVAAG